MKIEFQGDPTEILSFIHQLPGSQTAISPPADDTIAKAISLITDQANTLDTSDFYNRGKRDGLFAAVDIIRASLLGSAAPKVLAEAIVEPAPMPVLSEPAPIVPEQVETPDGRQPALKDQITHFLEQRGRAKLGEIAKGVGLPNAKVSPRLAELCASGFVIRAPAENDKRGLQTEYEFGRRYVASGRVGRPRSTEQTEQPSQAVAPVVDAAEEAKTPFIPERAKTLKETILNFLVEYGERASIKEIAEYLSFENQAVRSRLFELNKMGFVQRHEIDGAISYTALKTWAGDPLPTDAPNEQPQEVPSEQPAQPPEPSKPMMPPEPEAKKKRQPAMKHAITDIIAKFGGRVAANKIIAEMQGVRGKTVHARLAEMKHDGVVERHFDPVTRQSEWELLRPYSHEQKLLLSEAQPEVEQQQPAVEEAPTVVGVDDIHTEQLRIMGALADTAEASYDDLVNLIGMERNQLTKRLSELQKMGLVEREGHNPVRFIGRPPTRKNQKPVPASSLNEAVISAVRQYPGQTSAQLAIRMMKSWSEVARRLHDLEKNVVECRITDKERYYIR